METPHFDRLAMRLRALDLPLGEFVVFGSGPLAVRGLRDASDLDLLVTPALWDELAERFPREETPTGPLLRLDDGVEAFRTWHPPVGSTTDLVAEAELIDGLPYVRLEMVLLWKRRRDLPKDRADAEVLRSVLVVRPSGQHELTDAERGREIEWSELGVRTEKLLRTAGIQTIGDLVDQTRTELRARVRSRKACKEVAEWLETIYPTEPKSGVRSRSDEEE